jgi:hypothetical protein
VANRIRQPGAGHASGDIVRRALTRGDLVPLCGLPEGGA